MNLDQVLGAVRSLIAAFGGYAIGRGWINSDQLTLIGGVAASLVPLIWSIFVHTDSAKITAVAELPEVSKIVVKPTAQQDSAAAIAANDPSQPKVAVATASR